MKNPGDIINILIWLIVIFLIGGLIFGAFRGMQIIDEERGEILKNCLPTNLYAVDCRGCPARIYKCEDGRTRDRSVFRYGEK